MPDLTTGGYRWIRIWLCRDHALPEIEDVGDTAREPPQASGRVPLAAGGLHDTPKIMFERLQSQNSLLSGRNFETRDFEEEIAINSYAKLKEGVLEFINETNFKRFLMIIKSAGFITER